MRRQSKLLVTTLLLACSLAGCATSPTAPVGGRDATLRFLHYPEFQEAARVAPRLISDMMNEITSLERELATR